MARRKYSRDRSLRFETLESRQLLAGDFELLKDISANFGALGGPTELVEVAGTLFFSAESPTSGRELWKSDGTTAGTIQVKDIRLGSDSSAPFALTNVEGTLYFFANDGATGHELWRSDGTEAGTSRVKDVRSSGNSIPSISSSRPVAVGGTLFFVANDGVSGYELWKSDGTEPGTALVKEILPGSSGSMSFPTMLNVGGTLYFSANDGVHGRELWKSDGTEAGTVQIKDIFPGSSGSTNGGFAYVGGLIYFGASDGLSGLELWKSDGTESGTMRVKDIRSGVAGSLPNVTLTTAPTTLTNVAGTLFFSANDGVRGYELWRSDGTEAGTMLVKDVRSGSVSAFLGELTAVDGKLFFVADDGVNGRELWRSDGIESGTSLTKDVRTGSGSSLRISDVSSRNSLKNVAGNLYFAANDGVTGYELWKSDGTTGGTILVKEFSPGDNYDGPRSSTLVGDRLFVVARTSEHGLEIWTASVATPPTLAGDFNRDGAVTSADHTFWKNSFGSAINLAADGNNNGVVDAADYNIWRDNYTPPATVARATTAVSASVAPLTPAVSIAKPTSGSERGPIAASPQRRDALLIAAREAAFVEFKSSDSAPCGPLAHGSENEESTESAARDGVFELLGQRENLVGPLKPR
jgi:ELWxxDGT repeat protein